MTHETFKNISNGTLTCRLLLSLPLQIFAVQHVDVCMFSNGKFKNIVAEVDVSKHIGPSETLHGVYSLLPIRGKKEYLIRPIYPSFPSIQLIASFIIYLRSGSTKNWIAVEGALFSTSNYDTSLAALNSKLASSAPRGSAFTCFQPQIQSSSSTSLHPSGDEKNVFAIYVSYYVKVKLSLSGMGGEVTLKLPFILGNIDSEGHVVDKAILPNHSNDLHLNDHQTLNDIRRPTFDRSESLSENKYDENVGESQLLSRNSSVNCKSIDYDDVADNVTEHMSINNEEMDFINQKFSEMNRRNSNQSSDSSTSEVEENESNKQEISVIQAQVHCQKYLESDI